MEYLRVSFLTMASSLIQSTTKICVPNLESKSIFTPESSQVEVTNKDVEKKVRRKERILGGGTFGNLVGIQDDSQDTNRENTFALAYESEAIIPVEVPSYRAQSFNFEQNVRALEES